MRCIRLLTATLLALCALFALAASPTLAATYYVSPAGDDSNPGTQAQPWRTLQHAAIMPSPGDTILIADGDYAGMLIHKSGQPGAPITFRAVNPGGPLVHGEQVAEIDAVWIEGQHDVVIDGLTVTKAARTGIRVDNSNRCTVRRCRCLNNGKWGIFTDYSDDTLLEYNECAFSVEQHGIYASNSGDRPIIRFNTVHDCPACGIQVNADASLINPNIGTRGDGITENAVVDSNVVYNCGWEAGAGINIASNRNSRYSNNLIYNCQAGGIALWDDGDGFDYGSKNNLILNNTIYFRPGEGRHCISFQNGSTGNIVLNNILYGGLRGPFEIDSYSDFTSDYNLLFSSGEPFVMHYDDFAYSVGFDDWKATTGNDLHSVWADPWFANATAEPFDWHVVGTSPAIHGGIARPDVPVDIDGNPRPTSGHSYIGCYESFVPITPPPAPEELNTLPADHRLEIDWTASARTSYYIVKRGNSATGPFEQIATTFATTYTDISLDNGRTYWYVVSAVNPAGEGPNSKAVSGVPADIPTYSYYIQVSPRWVTGSKSTTAIIKMSDPAPAGGMTFLLSSNKPTVASVPSSVTMPEGDTSVTFPVQTYVVQAGQGATITASTTYQKKIGTLHVLPPSLNAVTFGLDRVVGGMAFDAAVELTGPAPSRGFIISLVCDPELSVPSTVKVPAGATSIGFTVFSKKVKSATPAVVVGRDGIYHKGALVTVMAAAPSNLVLVVDDASGPAGATATLHATLVNKVTGDPQPGQAVTFKIDAKSAGTAVTDSAGTAVLQHTLVETVGAHQMYASFAGDGANPPTDSDPATLTVTAQPAGLTLAPVATKPGATAQLKATLKAGTKALSGKTITFTVGGNTVGTAVTNLSGLATFYYGIGLNAGTYTMTAQFAGDSSAGPSSATATMSVTAAATKIVADVLTAPAGSTVTFGASLLRVTDGAALAGRTLAFYSGTKLIGTGVTDGAGRATVSMKAPAAGVTSVITVKFAADASYGGTVANGSVTGG